MAAPLAIDFGTSNTVVAVWSEGLQEGEPLHIPDYGRFFDHEGERVPVVPSLVHYTDDDRRLVGNQVLEQNLYRSDQTFRWMKRHISNRSPAEIRVGGRKISSREAGRDFLASVLPFAASEVEEAGMDEIALTVPVQAFEHYQDWLASVAEEIGQPRLRLIDEPSAVALGYGAHIQPGDAYMVFDFGGGTLDVAVVLVEEEDAQDEVGRRCRILGKAGLDLGGMTIDQWLFERVLEENGRSESDCDVRQMSRALLAECEQAKEALSSHESARVAAINPETGRALSMEITRQGFEDLLDEKDFFSDIDRTLRRAMNRARERGYGEDQIQSVLMVGGSSLIPSVQKTIRRIFGKGRVELDHPLDACVRGAAAFAGGVDFYDHIHHDYAIRHVDSGSGEYAYRVIVPQGTDYPTETPVDRLTVKAIHDGQTHLGVAIFEVGETPRRRSREQSLELTFDPSGAARLASVEANETERRSRFWMNEDAPTFLEADPPAERGEARFELAFNVDANKRLLITSRDLSTGELTHEDYPVVKLS